MNDFFDLSGMAQHVLTGCRMSFPFVLWRFSFMRLLAVLSLSVAVTPCIGCGSGESPYPDRVPVAAIGRTEICESCGKSIGSVSKANLINVKGNQYVVCDEPCAHSLAENITRSRHGGHSHE
ncbi:hypothetical protein [Planctomycetes bacterium TBK1r]|uniref:hypothetical protein n=1 Tax=Stieleria magnilauensis TaxID=2527963 RepID=UPI00119EF973